MAVPTITSVSPSEGHSGGKTLVEIVGTNFALPPAPAATGPVATPNPSVKVTIGGRDATSVAVVSSTLLYCLTPKGDPAAAIGVTVSNLDTAGAVVSGEVVTRASSFTFKRPDLGEESELARVVRAFIQEVKRQIIANVNLSTHSDYDESTGDLLNLAYVQELPALVIGNLELPEDRIHAVQEPQDFDAGNNRFIERRPAVAVDVTMTLVGVSDNPIEILNLMQVVRMFFKKNPYLELNRSASDASLGSIRYEMDFSFGGPVSVQHQGDNTNVESFGGSIVIRGVILEDMPGISQTKPTGIPAKYPHEATTGFGYVSVDDETAVRVGTQLKDP